MRLGLLDFRSVRPRNIACDARFLTHLRIGTRRVMNACGGFQIATKRNTVSGDVRKVDPRANGMRRYQISFRRAESWASDPNRKEKDEKKTVERGDKAVLSAF